jgi:hypothetical protein
MFARKARRTPAIGMGAPAARDAERQAAPPPMASLSGIPAVAKDEPGAGGPAPAPVPAPAPAPVVPAPKRTITVMPISVGSSTRNPYPDIAKAAQVWAQCGVEIKYMIGKCWKSNVLDKMNPKDVLNEYTDASKPTAEEIEMISYQPGGSSVLHVYYVPSQSAGNRGESFLKGYTPTLPEACVVSDRDGAADTLAHEIGHILLGMPGVPHVADTNNVMAGGDRKIGVDKVTAAQCASI